MMLEVFRWGVASAFGLRYVREYNSRVPRSVEFRKQERRKVKKGTAEHNRTLSTNSLLFHQRTNLPVPLLPELRRSASTST